MTFGDAVRRAALEHGHALPPSSHPEPLAALAYADELAIKQRALDAFWRAQGLAGAPEPIVAAPRPRGYRTTTTRRAAVHKGRLTLWFAGARGDEDVSASALDGPEHAAVYAFLARSLARAGLRALAESLHFAIVRGTAGKLAVILNVQVFDARVVGAAKQLAELLKDDTLGIRSAFLYLDPTASDYYLEARRPAGVLSFKRLFGPEWLEVTVEDRRLRFPPTVFSQVNEAMLPLMIERVAELSAPLAGRTLLDLYCGYGLFALTAGRAAAHVVAVDYDGPAVEAARANALHFGEATRVRFHAGRIEAAFIRGLRRARGAEVALLDPPRQGTERGVVEAVAERRPETVVHICCGADEIPREVLSWTRAGYRLRRAVPLDLFAGTAGLETLLQLSLQ
jgi:tRNA/tmRNA/rRNA uracil-C5-methylase (TrmA/RlmC/RlmD family)